MNISLYMFLIYLGRHYQYQNNLANPSMVNFIQIKKKIGITSLILELVKFHWKLLIIRQVILITSTGITWSIGPSLKNCLCAIFQMRKKYPTLYFHLQSEHNFLFVCDLLLMLTNFYSCAKFFTRFPRALLLQIFLAENQFLLFGSYNKMDFDKTCSWK